MKTIAALAAVLCITAFAAPAEAGRGHHGRGDHRRDVCFDLAFSAYGTVWSESYALGEAMELCEADPDGDVLALAYRVYDSVWSETYAIEQAAKFASNDDLRGKGYLLRFAFDRYNTVWSDTYALSEAGKLVADIPHGSYRCIERWTAVLDETWSETYALEQAVEKCTE